MRTTRALGVAVIAGVVGFAGVGTGCARNTTTAELDTGRAATAITQTVGAAVTGGALITGTSGSAAPQRTDPHEAATIRHVQDGLAQTPQFPGAVTVSSAPEPDLADQAGLIIPPTFVQRNAWWTSPMTSDQFHDWLSSHLPQGWLLPTGSDDDPIGDWGRGGHLEQYVAGPRSDSVWTYSAANVYWVPDGKGIAIRVAVQAYWVATRLKDEHIADTANSVDVTVFRKVPGFTDTGIVPPTVHRTVTGRNAQKLRDLVNSLNLWTNTGVHGCLAETGLTDVLVFRGGSASTTVTVYSDGCTGSSFATDGHTFPPLEDSVVHAELVNMFGL